MSRLRLPDVTLVIVETSAMVPLMRHALLSCVGDVDFAEVLVLSDERPLPDVRLHVIDPIGSMDVATRHYWYTVPGLVQTSHFLLIQWDSWVLNASSWRDDFLEYDYVGAPWWRVTEPHNVGNGGFSLRSVRFMRHVAEKVHFGNPEDDVICRQHGSELEAEGFKFASTEKAIHFAFERLRPTDPEQNLLPTFGFHGMFNWPDALTDEQIAARLACAPPRVTSGEHYFQMNHELSRRGRRPHDKPVGGRVYAA